MEIAKTCVAFAALCALSVSASAEFKDTLHRVPGADEVAVTGPGSYAEAGRTYVLTQDVSSDRTPIFLGNNVTLDLNGYTVTFAAGKYEHVPNYGFEEGLKGWDVTKAPGAKVVSSGIRPMVGEKILELKAGDEIVSQYITLPVADRSYYAMCSVATDHMKVTINVDDEKGEPVKCEYNGGSKPRQSAPLVKQEPKLGGGVLFAHLHYLPAGKYRIRIKADTDALIDECDIRPSLDTGVAVVGAVKPYATWADVIKWYPCDFFDYNQKNGKAGIPVEGVPIVKGPGAVTIKNGTIRNGTLGMRTLGVNANAPDVTVALENLKIVNAGINTNAARLVNGALKNCRFEIDTPFIMNRHDTSEMSVNAGRLAEISHCEFLGGQGNFAGECPDIHDNLFANGQTVTNHYSIGPRTGTKIYRNRFEPKIGSGIYIGGGHDVDVYDNVFKIEAAPPNCEYRYSAYSTNAVRLSDYDTPPTGPVERRCANNRVHDNKIFIKGTSYPQYDKYTPSTYAFFISVGGGTNYVYNNEIVVEKQPGNSRAFAFFIGGTSNGGEIYNNKVTSNCPVAYIGNDYGNAADTLFYGNTFLREANTPAGTKAFVLGDGGNYVKDVGFFSNVFEGWTDLFDYHSNAIAYSFGHTLKVLVLDKAGNPKAAAEVVAESAGQTVKKTTDDKGVAALRLAEYNYVNGKKTECGAWTVKCGAAETKADAKKDSAATLRVD